MLDKFSRKFCLQLRHIVVFSSVSCGRGNAGQTNYGTANSVMERVCEKRVEEGLPGLAIQWEAVGDVVADLQEDDKELVNGRTLQQKISCCLDELDKFLLQSRAVVSSMIVAEKNAGSSGFKSLIETVANILEIKDMKVVSRNSSLAELGMDSMMTVEIKQTLEREFDIFLTAQEIRNLTFAKLNKTSSANISNDNIQDEKELDTEEPNHMLPQLQNGRDSIIVGYSFGSITAIELTRRLEIMNFKGLIVLIDGALEQIGTMYKHFISDSNEENLQIIVLTNIMEIFFYTAGTGKAILMELKKCKTWEERFNIFAKQFLAINTLLSPTNLKTLCTTVYKYLSAIRQYDPSILSPIKSPIILLKPTLPFISVIEEDYDLHKVTQNVVKIHYIEGNHLTILKNEKVSAAINGELP